MEALLSHAFDNIASRDVGKIRKGLRQIEGLLGQICQVSRTSTTTNSNDGTSSSSQQLSAAQADGEKRHGHKRGGSAATAAADRGSGEKVALASVARDPAFREFFRLQEGFEGNVASRLIATLERLLGFPSTAQTTPLIHHALCLLQGTLLLHPPSRTLFRREPPMVLLLDLLLLDCTPPPPSRPSSCIIDPSEPFPTSTPDPARIATQIQSQTLLTLVTALLGQTANIRAFEALGGLETVASLFKSRATDRAVKLRCVEVWYFYLMEERDDRHPDPGGERVDGDGSAGAQVRSTDEKTALLARYVANAAELVADLREAADAAVRDAGSVQASISQLVGVGKSVEGVRGAQTQTRGGGQEKARRRDGRREQGADRGLRGGGAGGGGGGRPPAVVEQRGKAIVA